MDDFVITIPDDMDYYTCDIGTFTIWCRQAMVIFALVDVDQELYVSASYHCLLL